MPIYEYKCLNCNESFETLVLNSEEEVFCSICESANLEKQFSPFGIKSEGAATSPGPSGAGCGCSPVTCGCGVRN